MKGNKCILRERNCHSRIPDQVIITLFTLSLIVLFAGCRKEIEEPKHKNKGKNIIYLKIDDQEFLIKEGFSLNRNVIRAEIGGVNTGKAPTYNEGEYFGRKTASLSFNFFPKKGSDAIGPSAIDIEYYKDNFEVKGLFNSLNVDFFSEKHNTYITIWKKGYGWNDKLLPEIKILKQDTERKIISGSIYYNYRDFSDSSLTGNFYLYFDLEYESI